MILVTGGTGFLGAHCIGELLERGHQVRTTVRDLKRTADVHAAAGTDAVEVVAANLLDDAGWEEAVSGCSHVLHVASPFPPKQPKDPDELIVPARDGALRVLKAALKADVQRVVLTSSVAAVRGGRDGVFTEADWTDPDDTARTPYVRSKTIAERAAWGLVMSNDARDRLAVVNPGAIIGPVRSEDLSFSHELITRLLGGIPAMPRLGFPFVDARDCADLHIRAMTAPEAGGERYLATDEFLWMHEVAAILRERLGDEARKVPTRKAPDILVKAMALFDPSMKSIVGDLGKQSKYDSSKARETLGWSPRPVADSITDTAHSLLQRKLV